MTAFWACACKLSWTLLSHARVQPLYGAGRKESSGTGVGISVFYNLLWFCFIIVTVRVTFKFIYLDRFRLSGDEDLRNFLVSDKSDNRSVRWRRQEYWFIRNCSGWIFFAAIWKRKLAPCSSFCSALSYTAGERAPVQFVVRCLPSNGSLSHCSVMFCPFFHGDFRLFWNTSCWQWGHKFGGTEWHTTV